jgi:VanZ family protein
MLPVTLSLCYCVTLLLSLTLYHSFKMKLSIKALTWFLIGYVLTILALSVAVINTKVALNQSWVLHVRFDHLLHVLLFIPWMVLARWRWQGKKSFGFYFLALAAGLLLAMVSEGVQIILPYRSFNIVDLGANCVGVVLGGMIGWQIME